MIIKINRQKCMSLVGVSDEERAVPREIVINVEMKAESESAIETDDIDLAVDYADVAMRIDKFATSREFCLIETIAGGVLEEILSDSRVNWARVEVEKPGAIPESDSVSVCVERSTTG